MTAPSPTDPAGEAAALEAAAAAAWWEAAVFAQAVHLERNPHIRSRRAATAGRLAVEARELGDQARAARIVAGAFPNQEDQ